MNLVANRMYQSYDRSEHGSSFDFRNRLLSSFNKKKFLSGFSYFFHHQKRWSVFLVVKVLSAGNVGCFDQAIVFPLSVCSFMQTKLQWRLWTTQFSRILCFCTLSCDYNKLNNPVSSLIGFHNLTFMYHWLYLVLLNMELFFEWK